MSKQITPAQRKTLLAELARGSTPRYLADKYRKWGLGTAAIRALQASVGEQAAAPATRTQSTRQRHLVAVREAIKRNLTMQRACKGRGLPALQDKMLALQQEERALEGELEEQGEVIPRVLVEYLAATQAILTPEQKATLDQQMEQRHGREWDRQMPVPPTSEKKDGAKDETKI